MGNIFFLQKSYCKPNAPKQMFPTEVGYFFINNIPKTISGIRLTNHTSNAKKSGRNGSSHATDKIIVTANVTYGLFSNIICIKGKQ